MEKPVQLQPHFSDLRPLPEAKQPTLLSDLPALVTVPSEQVILQRHQEASRGFADLATNLAQVSRHPQSPSRPDITRSYSPILPDITQSSPQPIRTTSQPAFHDSTLESKTMAEPKKTTQPTQFWKNTILASETLNIGTASFNYYYTLNFDHAIALITSASHIHITLYGITKFSAIGNAISPLYTLYNYGLAWAIPHAAAAIGFMLLPTGKLLGAISVVSAAYGLWYTYQTNYGDQYYPAYIQSYKAWSEAAKFPAENARIQFLREFFASKVEEYEKEIVSFQNIIKKNEYSSCLYKAEQEERNKIKLGESVVKAMENKKEAFKNCESLLPLEEQSASVADTTSMGSPISDENHEQELSGTQWKDRTEL